MGTGSSSRFFSFSEAEWTERSLRSKGLLKRVLVIIIILLFLYIVIREIQNFSLALPEIALFTILAVIILAYILLRKGFFVLSAVITILITFSGMTFIAMTSMGIRDAGVLSYLIIIYFASLLLGKLPATIMTVLSVAAIWIMIYLENHGLLIYDPWAVELIARDYTFILISTLALTIFYDNVLNRYITEIKDSRKNYRNVNTRLTTQNRQILKINKELQRVTEKAEESDRLKTAFLTNLSHEIRTPMNGIIGFSELALSPDVSDKDRKDYNSIVANSCKQLLGVVNDIIDISKIESGIIELSEESFNLNKSLQDIYKLFSLSSQEQKIDLELISGLEDKEADILCDHVKLQQIISNLLGNAIKFTSKGGVKFGYSLADDFLEFYVIDTGIGIKKQDHESIFERFTQNNTNTGLVRNHGGTGLGLSIAKAYVEKLGGKIWLESELNAGSKFFFTIPYKKVMIGSTADQRQERGKPSGIIKVLLVEDLEVNEQLLIKMMRKFQFEIVVAKTGEEAVDTFNNTEDFALVLMDIKLPGMDGYEATRIIRKQNSSIPIIAQTAHAFAADRDKAFAAGCNDIITKPITQKALDESIRKSLKIK